MLLRKILIPLLIAPVALVLVAAPAYAATTLSAEIVSWQVVGLDSNDPTTALPEFFMVQAKVTNTGAEPASAAEAAISFGAPTPTDCGGPCIFLVSSATYSIGTIAPAATADAYWTIRVAKTAAALGTSTPVTVTASASNAPSVVATQAARTGLCSPDTPGGVLYVERLISQNRNQVLSYAVSPGVQRADGSWEVVLGSAFNVTVLAHTATTYDEISVPAVVDPSGTITPVSTNFTFEMGGTDDDIYSLDAGGDVTSIYGYRAASIGTVTLSQLIYDCSGGSFHYNSDYRLNSVTIHVVGAPSLPNLVLEKTSSPSGTVAPGDRVTFTITYRNTGIVAATNVVITDIIDPGLTNISPNNGGTFDAGTRTIVWNIGTVAPGASGGVSFTALIGSSTSGQILNTARATASEIPDVTSDQVRLLLSIPNTGSLTDLLLILGLASLGAGLGFRLRSSPDACTARR